MAAREFDKTFASEAEAQEWADQYRQSMWGYDPTVRVWQRGSEWIASVSVRDSCD